MTLRFQAPLPTYALLRHGVGAPFFYWRSPGGASVSGFDVQSSLEGFGWLQYDWAPVAPPCAQPRHVRVGSADPSFCRSETVTEMLLAGEERRDGWLEGADVSKNHGLPTSRCPTASYTALLPMLRDDGVAGEQELRLLRKANSEPYASRLPSRKVFDCRTRTLTSLLPDVRRDTDGPVDGWGDGDPRAPSWPHWHMTTTMQWKFTFKRIGCGKGR